jgi:hypothetical protein
MITQFRHAFLQASSSRVSDPAEIDGNYDLMVLVSSWDSRCACLASSKALSAQRAILLLFDTRDSFGLRDKHDAILEGFCKSASRKYIPIRRASTNLESIWTEICANMREMLVELCRPLRVLLDLSTCPRYYAGAILAECFKTGLARSATVFYAEGRYPEQPDVTFSQGGWRAVAVPGLDGRYDPRKKRFYLVSVGWEGWRTLRVVSRADPDQVSVLFPDPGVRPDYVAEAQKENRDLITEYCIPEPHIIRTAAADAIGAWKALSERSIEQPDKYNVTYLVTGTKPHAVALALRAIVLEYPALVYVVPEEHSVLRTEPNGVFWRFDIRDLTAMPFARENA